MVIVLAFQIYILLMGFTALFSKGTQLYESWHEFPIDLLYKDVSSYRDSTAGNRGGGPVKLDSMWQHRLTRLVRDRYITAYVLPKASELVPCSLLPHWNSMRFFATVSLSQTLHARIRFAPSSVECRPWHLLTWPESARCLLGHLHWRPWPVKHVRGYNRAYNCEWMSGTVHINWIMFLGTCFHWQKVFIILRCRKLLKIALDLRWSVWFLGSQGAWKPKHAVWICAEQVMESTCLQEKSKIF